MPAPPDGPRIGLLTPYSGTNLGDAAIQAAVIRQLRRRVPHISFTGLVLNGRLVSAAHDIPCFPLTFQTIAFYAHPDAPPPASTPAAPPAGGHGMSALRTALKRMPLLGPALRALVRGARALARVPLEVRHVRAAAAQVRALDLLLVSGGGQLDDTWGGPWGHPYALWKWTTLARFLGRPVVIASVGAGSLSSALSRWFVRGALRAAAMRSYRDPGSRDLVAGRGVRTDPVVPDLALALDVPPAPPAPSGGRAAVVGIAPISLGTVGPERAPDRYRAYLDPLVACAARLLERGMSVVVLSTTASDWPATRDFADRLRAAASPEAAARVRVADTRTLDAVVETLLSVDCVIASRLHGVMLGHVAGRPVVGVAAERKVHAHMALTDSAAWCVDVRDATAEVLEERVLAALADAALPAAVTNAVRRQRAAVERQFDDIAALCAASPRRRAAGPVR